MQSATDVVASGWDGAGVGATAAVEPGDSGSATEVPDCPASGLTEELESSEEEAVEGDPEGTEPRLLGVFAGTLEGELGIWVPLGPLDGDIGTLPLGEELGLEGSLSGTPSGQ